MNLYKYSSINDNTITNLKNNQVYLQSPNMFNDPYEFIFKLNVKDEIFTDFLKLIYGKGYMEILREKLPKEKILSNIRDYYYPQYRQSMGAICLTENENDDIMWAHYGDNHKGICIEYDKTKHPFNLFEQVEYTNEVLDIKIENLSNFELKIPIMFNDIFIRKNMKWSYENEWRLISIAGSTINYPKDALKSITFGFFCDEKNKAKIYDATNDLKIKYYDVVRAKDAYIIEKRPIEINID